MCADANICEFLGMDACKLKFLMSTISTCVQKNLMYRACVCAVSFGPFIEKRNAEGGDDGNSIARKTKTSYSSDV